MSGRDDRLDVRDSCRPTAPARCTRRRRRVGAERVQIGVRGAENGLDPSLAAGADDAHRDLAAVGDEDAADAIAEAVFRRMEHLAGLDELAVRARISTIAAAAAGAIEFISFIVSMMPTTRVLATSAADFDEGRRAGLGRAIEGADHRRAHGDEARDLALVAQRLRGYRRRLRGRVEDMGLAVACASPASSRRGRDADAARTAPSSDAARHAAWNRG